MNEAPETAARLWPGPDPVEWCKREAVSRLLEFEAALERIGDLQMRVYAALFDDLVNLWIRPTPTEDLLDELRGTIRQMQSAVADADDYMESARSENEHRFYEERILDRIEGRSRVAAP